jgi:hypothetical protein
VAWARWSPYGCRERLAFCHHVFGPPWPAVDDASLLDRASEWLDLSAARHGADLARIDVTSALRRPLPWPQAGRLDELAPERLPVPSGSRSASCTAVSRPPPPMTNTPPGLITRKINKLSLDNKAQAGPWMGMRCRMAG